MTTIRSCPWAAAFAAALVGTTATLRADVRLPAIFSDHMVLQCEKAPAVWGWAEPGEAVTVSLGTASLGGKEKSTTAADDGRWRVTLEPPMARNESQTLTVRGRNTLAIDDVLVGEVWLCSGQSNSSMAFEVKWSHR